MNSQTLHTQQKKPPLRFWLTLLHLGAMGSIGSALMGIYTATFGAGLAFVPLLGFGFVLLVGLLYATWGTAWFETERVSALYHLDTNPLAFPKRQKAGFGGWIHSLWLILKQGRMWAAVGSFVASTILGAVMFGALQWGSRTLLHAVFGRSGLTGFSPLFGDASGWIVPVADFIIVFICAAVIFGTVLLHRLITTAIIGAASRETHLNEQVRQSSLQREGAVRSAQVERERIERDLHDGVQPRLVSIGMTLGIAQQQLPHNPDKASELVAEAHQSTQHAITELRQLTRGIYASVLDDRGLDAALSAVAARSHVPVHLDVRVSETVNKDAETATYFAIAESLTNVTKHSHASQCRVVVRVRNDQNDPRLWARVEDDGVGGARVTPGGGLDGIVGRVTAAGGTLTIDSPEGGPTTIEMSTPCAS